MFAIKISRKNLTSSSNRWGRNEEISLNSFFFSTVLVGTALCDDQVTIDGQIPQGHIIEGGGTRLRQEPILSFTGDSVTATSTGGKTIVEIDAGNALIAGDAPDDPRESCEPSEIAYDTDFLYVCIDPDVWLRAPLETWVATECNAMLNEDGGYMLSENGTKMGNEIQNACVCEQANVLSPDGNEVFTNLGNRLVFDLCGLPTTCNIVVTSVGNTVVSPIGNQLITNVCEEQEETICNILITNAGNFVYTSSGNRVITNRCTGYDNVITTDGDNVINDSDQVVAP